MKTETKNAARFVYGFTVVDVLMNQIVLLLPLIVKCSLYNNLELFCSTLFLDFSDATLQVKIVLNLPKNVILYTLILKIRCKESALSASFVHKAKPQFIIRTCHLRSVKCLSEVQINIKWLLFSRHYEVVETTAFCITLTPTLIQVLPKRER